MAAAALLETVWVDKFLYDDAECEYYTRLNNKLSDEPKGCVPETCIPNPEKPAGRNEPEKSPKPKPQENQPKSKKNKKGNKSRNQSESEPDKVPHEDVKPPQNKGNKKNKKDRKESESKEIQPSENKVFVEEKGGSSEVICSQSSLANEVAKARQHIKNSLECMDTVLSSVNNSTMMTMATVNTALTEMKSLILGFRQELDQLKQQVAALSVK